MSATNGYRGFSPGRIFALARNTVTELVRQRVFYFLLLFALLLIGASVILIRFSFQDQFQMLKDISLGAMSIFSSLIAVLATAAMLPKDIEDRTIHTILAKPVPRYEYVLGRFLGIAALLALALVLMGLVFALVLAVREQAVETETLVELRALGGDAVAARIGELRASVFNPNLLAGLSLIYAKACVLAALTLLVSTFASSSIYTLLLMAMVYFIGHFQATAREYWQASSEAGGSALAKVFLALVSIVFPDLQIFNLVDEIVVGLAVPPALLGRTLALGGFYIAIYLCAAHFVFAQKEL